MPSTLIFDAPGVADSGLSGEWWTARETSAFARVTEKTLANWRSLGLGPPFKKLSPGRSGRILYRRLDVEVWLSSRAGSSGR